MQSLTHNGVLLPKQYEAKGLHIFVKGKKIELTREQEEMAVAWAKKLDTEYVQDPVFVENFLKDFQFALAISGDLKTKDFDFSSVKSAVDQEKVAKQNLSSEEKKRLAAERKAQREANKERYGYAVVDGQRVELGNYTVEPSSLFMGRGKHPLRGRWKPAVSEEDITLNLDEESQKKFLNAHPGTKFKCTWQPDSMWIARWDDKLRGVEKYIWMADSSPVKQRREIEKFDQALALEKKYPSLRQHIIRNLHAADAKRRKIATVCYLIDEMKFRVGDEKDEDEADTVGVTTLRAEHVQFHENNMVRFDFLGKDSIRLEAEVQLHPDAVRNLKGLIAETKSEIFTGVNSDHVKALLNEVVPGLTAKVFRTFHATVTVRDYLSKSKLEKRVPEYLKKKEAAMANLQAAILCNHKRKLPKKWDESLKKKEERLDQLKAKNTPKSLERAKELQTRIEVLKATKEYNLGTSLKSYIDPRVYFKWCRKVGYDWKKFYPKTLQKKFSWLEPSPETMTTPQPEETTISTPK